MGLMGRTFVLAALLLGVASPAAAAAMGKGILDGSNHILGRLGPKDADAAKKEFAEGITTPLLLKLDVDSSPLALMQLGEWLHAQHPILDLKGSCVGSCAIFVLGSGRAVQIRPGTLIAFSAMDEWMAKVQDEVRAGKTAIEDSRSLASRDRFLERFKPVFDSSEALRAGADRLGTLPAKALDFVRRLTSMLEIGKLAFDDEHANINLNAKPGHCLWWIPDADGLRQLGLDVPGYRPVSRAEAARQLKEVNAKMLVGKNIEALIYIGPIADELPPQGLCPVTASP